MLDLIIIGAGQAGLTAGIYAARYNLKTKIFTKDVGGQATDAVIVENYPGFEKISGKELIERIKKQVEKLGIKIITSEILDIFPKKDYFEIQTSEARNYQTKTILFALGTEKRKLNIKDEDKFIGRGISYCFTCDGPLFKNKIVAVAGGGNAGLMAASYLSGIAKKVYLIEILDKLPADPFWQQKIVKLKNIEILTSTEIIKLLGNHFLSSINIKQKTKERNLKIDGLFVETGSVPNTELAEKLKIKLDKNGLILIDSGGRTTIKGLYAAGDVTSGSDQFRQMITAMAEGAIAAHSIFKDLKK